MQQPPTEPLRFPLVSDQDHSDSPQTHYPFESSSSSSSVSGMSAVATNPVPAPAHWIRRVWISLGISRAILAGSVVVLLLNHCRSSSRGNRNRQPKQRWQRCQRQAAAVDRLGCTKHKTNTLEPRPCPFVPPSAKPWTRYDLPYTLNPKPIAFASSLGRRSRRRRVWYLGLPHK